MKIPTSLASPDKLSWFSASTVLLLLPALFVTNAIDPVSMPRMIAAGAALSIAFFWLMITGRKQPLSMLSSLHQPAIWLLGIWVAVFIAAFLSHPNISEGLPEGARLYLFCGYLVLFSLLFNLNERLLFVLAMAAIISATVLSLVGILQYFDLGFRWIPGHFIISGTMTNKNLFASALVILIPLCSFGLLYFSGWRFLLSISALSLASFAIGLAHTRASWLALALWFAAVLLLSYRSGSRFSLTPALQTLFRKRIRLILPLMLLSFILAIGAHRLYTRHDQATGTVVSGTFNTFSSIDERMILWQHAWKIGCENPFLGAGPGMWKIENLRLGTEGLRSSGGHVNFVRPHNDYLWIFAEYGATGLLAYLAFLWALLIAALRVIRAPTTPDARIVAVICALGVLSYMVVALFSFPRERIFHHLLLAIYAAPLLHLRFTVAPPSVRSSRAAERAVYALFVTAGILVVMLGATRLRSEQHLRAGLQSRAAGQFDSAARHVSKAYTPFFRLDPAVTPVLLYRAMVYIQSQQFEKALPDLQQAHSDNPYHILTTGNLASINDQNGNSSEAIRLLLELLRISPNFEDGLLNLSVIYYRQGRYQEALEALERCHPASTNQRIPELRRRLEAALSAQ